MVDLFMYIDPEAKKTATAEEGAQLHADEDEKTSQKSSKTRLPFSRQQELIRVRSPLKLILQGEETILFE